MFKRLSNKMECKQCCMSARPDSHTVYKQGREDADVFCESVVMNCERRGTGWCGERRELLEMAGKITLVHQHADHCPRRSPFVTKT